MINIIKVQCPHCGVEGQLVLPESDTLIVGPCPECNKTLVIFAGKALPLDTNLMAHASREEAYAHLYEVLNAFIHERLDAIFNAPVKEENASPIEEPENGENSKKSGGSIHPTISVKEVNAFVKEELPLLDNNNYFRAIFG